MAYRADWTRYIRQRAAKYGVDPQAALAVASREGLSGAVGDQGTSFGPFQLHVGGALPAGRGRAWAESPAGIDYALGQMGGVARGLRGPQAVNAIVRRFERPADPNAEVAGAIGALGSFGGAGGGAALSPALPSFASGPAAGGQNIGAVIRQGILGAWRKGAEPDLLALLRNARQSAASQTAASQTASTGKPEDMAAAQFGGEAGKGGWFHPVSGKIIGTPFHGTHTLGNWESDRALDIAVPVGTPIYSPFGGTIGSQFGSLGAPGSSRFAGLRLHVQNPANEFYGAHLSRFAPGIKPGTRVRQGQLLGYSGSASGVAHLHEAVRSGNPYYLAQ